MTDIIMTKITKDTLTQGLIKGISAIKLAIVNGAKEETKNAVIIARKNLAEAMASYTPKTKGYERKNTGKLSANIYSDTHGIWQGRKIIFFVDINVSNVPYAIYVEKPHGRFPGYYMMENTYNQMSETFQVNMGRRISESLSKIRAF